MGRDFGREALYTLLIVCIGQFLTQMDLTVVNVAMSDIRSTLATSIASVAWVIDAYFLTFAAFMLVFGDLGDRLGRRLVFTWGLVAFAFASATCGLAPNVEILIAARAAQGVAGAAVLVSSLSLLSHAFPDRNKRAKAIGLWTSVSGIALVSGPLLGGALVASVGWRAVFAVNVPLALTGAGLARIRLAESTGQRGPAMDLGGAALVVVVLAAASAALSLGPQIGWWNPWVLIAVGSAVAAMFALWHIEAACAQPILPLRLLAKRSLLAANAAAMLVNFATLGLLFAATSYFEEVSRLGALRSGEQVAPMFITYALASAASGRIAARWGPRIPSFVGFGVAATAVVWLHAALAAHGEASGSHIELSLILAVAGAGVGLSLPAIVTAAVSAVPGSRAGLASGLNNTSRQIGGTLGIALLGGLVAAGRAGGGIRSALVVIAAVYVLGAAIMAIGFRPLPEESNAPAGMGEPSQRYAMSASEI